MPSSIIMLCIVFESLTCFSTLAGQTDSEDTLKLSLQDADSLFLSRNLSLMAQNYKIDENEANIIQARIWDLPTITINYNFYNPRDKKYFEFSQNTEASMQMQQLILLGRKRSKLVSMAQINKQIANYQYYDLLRNLKFQLHSSFYNCYFLREKLKIFETELPMLHQVLAGYETMYPRGFVSLKEIVRLKALLFSLENDKLDLLQQLHENEGVLRVMLNEKRHVEIRSLVNSVSLDGIRFDKYSLGALIDTALLNRSDMLAYQEQIKFSQTDLVYQKSQKIPNPTVIAGWDRQGSFVPDYNYLGLSFDLPFWNRNKGNIKAAEARIRENQAMLDNYSLQVSSEVEQSFVKAEEIQKLYDSADSKYNDDFIKIIRGVTESFLKHQVGLLEFIDLYESYKDSQTQYLQLQNDRIHAMENLNFSVGKSLN